MNYRPINKSAKNVPNRLIVCLILLYLSITSSIPARSQNNNGQNNNGQNNSNYEPYEPKGNGNGAAISRPERIVERNIDRAYQSLNKFVDKHGNKIANSVPGQKNKVTRYGERGPDNHPLEKNRLNGGKLDPAKSWNEYVMDSRIILNDLTFPQCMEPRLLAERKNGSVRVTDPANALYAAACAFNCPRSLFLFPINRNWQVVSYYWPEYQISVNKAGAQMIDPEIVRERRGPQELYRTPTSIKEDSDSVRGQQAQLQLLQAMGIPATDNQKFKDPDYHRATNEFHLRQDGELRYPSAMRPNAFWRAANSRRRQNIGYKRNNNCLFNALDPPTGTRKVIANRYDQGIYSILARYPEIRKRTDKERYRFTSPTASNLQDYRNFTPQQFKQSLCASWRMSSNPRVYEELQKAGFTGKDDPKFRDYCLPGGLDLSGSMLAEEGTPILQADAARAVMGAIYFGSTESQFQNMNRSGRRSAKYSLYKNRKNSSVRRYVDFEYSSGENKSNVVFLDKFQRIYPTQALNGEDGDGGASSKNFRTDVGQRGSHCFRPEDIPNWSSEGRTNKSEWPLGLMLDSSEHFGETRWAVWNRRVVCSCEDLGLFSGCLNLNDGDHEEEVFAGTIGYTGQKMPPAFEKAIPTVRSLANETSPPRSVRGGSSGFDLSSVTVDSRIAGSSLPIMPGRGQSAPQVAEPPSNVIDFLICTLVDNQQQGQQNNDQNQNGQNNNTNNGSNTGSSSGTGSGNGTNNGGGTSTGSGSGTGSSGGSGGGDLGGDFGGDFGGDLGGGFGGGPPT